MNTTNVVRAITVSAPNARAAAGSIKLRISAAWRAFTHRLFTESVVGNPLHEAWSADGEPLERTTPNELAKSCASRHLVVPHSRSR